MPSIMTVPVMFQQMKFCGQYHVNDTDKFTEPTIHKINRYLYSYWRSCVMAKHVNKAYPKPGFEPLTFINKKLNAQDLKKFEAWLGDDDVVYRSITQMLHEGYQPKIAHWGDKEVFNVLLMAPKEGSVNSGKALSSKSQDWFKGLAMCAYKHLIISGGDWSVFEEEDTLEG